VERFLCATTCCHIADDTLEAALGQSATDQLADKAAPVLAPEAPIVLNPLSLFKAFELLW